MTHATEEENDVDEEGEDGACRLDAVIVASQKALEPNRNQT